MSSLFEHADYKSCLRFFLDSEKGERGHRAALAKSIGCQAAYLSRVLNGEAHLSFEQGEAAARHFVFNRVETMYFLSLLGEERAGTSDLKKFWQDQRSRALMERLELSNRIQLSQNLSPTDLVTYFSSWHYAAIHTAVSIQDLQTAEAVSEYLQVSLDLVRKTLESLANFGLIQKLNQRFVPGAKSLHLDKHSPLVSKHHLNWRLKSMEALNQPKTSDLHYTSVVSLSRSDVDKIKEILLKAIEGVRLTVSSSREETLACYSVEFFELNRRGELK